MIKVLQIADKLAVGDATIHGVTRLLSWWIPRFDRSRYDVSVCSLRKRDRAGQYLENIGISVSYLNRGKFDPLTMTDLLCLLKREKVDVLHLHGYGAWTLGRIAGKYCGVPSIIHEHMVDRNIPLYQRITDKTLSKLTAHAIAIYISVKNFMTQYRYIYEPLVDVIINGIPLENFGEQFQNITSGIEEIYRKRFNIPYDHIIIGTVGRLDANKGHRDLSSSAGLASI